MNEALVSRFLDNACPDHHVRGRSDHARAMHTAIRILSRNPEIARTDFSTAIVCGGAGEVELQLKANPSLASRRDSAPAERRSGGGDFGDLYRDLGPKGWEPLLYLCFTRLPLPAVAENAVTIARMLLDNGADPRCFFMAGDSRYTPLVGAIGEGEEDRPPHPQRDALVELLLERGADPYDSQVIYNINFHGRVLWFLKLSYEHSVRAGRRADWDDPEWRMLDMGDYGSGARWHLEIAIKNDDAELAEWCLTHGANPNSAAAQDARFPQRTLYEEAVRRGRKEIAALLLGHGAEKIEVVLDPIDAFIGDCFRVDREAARAAVESNPALLESPEPLLTAAREDRADVAELLLDLGTSPDLANAEGERPLHRAAARDAMAVAKLLVERGAAIDPREKRYANTPLGFAVYYQNEEMIDYLARHSRDVWELTFAGKVDRLREVLAGEPELAKVEYEGHTPLMWLPPRDESVAMETAKLLIANGADPSIRNSEGMTAAERAESMAMPSVAALLRV